MRRREICRLRHRRLKTPRCHPRPQKNRFKLDHEQVDHTNRNCFMEVFLSHGSANDKNEGYMCSIDKCKCTDQCVCVAPSKWRVLGRMHLCKSSSN